MMFIPDNEQGVIAAFFSSLYKTKWKTVKVGTQFPDAVLELNGEIWRVEFEYKAKNFVSHGHDCRECDIIICWENDFPDCPIAVLSLCAKGWENKFPTKSDPLAVEAWYWKQRALRAERVVKLSAPVADTESNTRPKTPKIESLITILGFCRNKPSATLSDLQKITGKGKSTVSEYLTEMEASGIIKRDDSGIKVVGELTH